MLKSILPTTVALSALIMLANCASTSVTPLAANQVMISTSAAPACGSSGAQKVAAQMAAVETIRRGYERFIIAGANSQNNVSVTQMAPTTAYTTGTFNTYGNTTYGNATTTYGGGGPLIAGSHDASLVVVMFKQGDRDYGNAVDAKSTLGEDWQKLVEDGVNTCG